MYHFLIHHVQNNVSFSYTEYPHNTPLVNIVRFPYAKYPLNILITVTPITVRFPRYMILSGFLVCGYFRVLHLN